MDQVNLHIDNEDPALTHSESINPIATFLNNIHGSIFVLSSHGDFTHLNVAAAQLLQRKQEKLLGKNIWVEFPVLNDNQFKYNFQLALEKKLASEFQFYYPPLLSWLNIQMYPMEEGLLVILKKTSDKTISEPIPAKENEGLRRFDRDVGEDILMLQTVFENSPDGLIFGTTQGKILEVNPATCKILGYTREELLQLSRIDIVDIADPRFKEFLGKRNKDGYAFSELILTRKSGDKFLAEVTSNIFYIANGEARASLIFRDISQRKRDEQTLHEREEQFYKAFKSAPMALSISTLHEGLYIDVNDSFLEITEYRRDEVIGRSVFQVLGIKLAEREEWLKQVASFGVHKNFETIITNKNGQKLIVIASTSKEVINGKEYLITSFYDVTELKKAQETLQQSKERFFEIFHNAPVLITIANGTDGRISEANDKWLKATGYTREETIGHTSTELGIWDSTERNTVYSELEKFGTVNNFETKFRTKNGELRDVLVSFSEIKIKEQAYFLGMALDITERKKLEEALHRSEIRFQAFMENSSTSAMIVDYNGDIQYVNNAYKLMTGIELEKLIGHSAFEIFPPEYADQYIKPIRQVLETGVPKEIFETFVKPDGCIGTALVHLFPIPDSNGEKVIGEIAVDITERVKAEEALQNEKERLDITLRSIRDGVVVANREGKIEIFNQAAENMTDWLQEEAVGQPLDKVIQMVNSRTGEHLESQLLQQLLNGESVQQENEHYILVARNGNTRYISYQGAPLLNKKGDFLGTVLAFLDITDKKKLTEERLKARNLESLGVLAGGIAHNFNNILTAILGNISLAMMETDETSSNFEYLQEAEKASFRAKDMAQRLVTFAKGGSPHKQSIRIQDVVKGTVQFMLQSTKSHAEFDLSDDTWNTMVDQGQFSQVIQNLVQNALDAMPNGGVLNVRTTNIILEAEQIPTLSSGKYVLLTIRDQGVGIPADNMSMIFDPYFTTKIAGSGLGLSICYSIMRKHDGQIAIESEEGKGTIVSLYLPAFIRPGTGKLSTLSTSPIRLRRILFVDEEESTRTIVSKLLIKIGYEIETVETSEAAIQAIQTEQPFNAVILELGGSGSNRAKNLIEIVHKLDPNIKSLGVTDYINDPIMTYYREYGFDGAICKPFTPSLLERALHEILKP